MDIESSKIVASLRHYADRSDPTQLRWSPQDLLTQAADAIERLDAELAKTREEGFDNEMCAAAVVEIRKACKEIMGGNCSFVDDDFARCLYTLKAERDRLRTALEDIKSVCRMNRPAISKPFEYIVDAIEKALRPAVL